MTFSVAHSRSLRRVAARPAAAERRRLGGFTMVEVLVVLFIITILFSMVMVAAVRNRRTAAIEASKALLSRIELALDRYHTLHGHYPPDGFDTEVRNDEGTAIRGSACLHYFLTKEQKIVKKVGGQTRVSVEPPLLEVTEKELTEESSDHPGARELLDGFLEPIHYDNTENGVFTPQAGAAHTPELERHPPDPRESTEYGAVEKEGIQKAGRYDLWSHGQGRHLELDDLSGTIANWNLSKD